MESALPGSGTRLLKAVGLRQELKSGACGGSPPGGLPRRLLCVPGDLGSGLRRLFPVAPGSQGNGPDPTQARRHRQEFAVLASGPEPRQDASRGRNDDIGYNERRCTSDPRGTRAQPPTASLRGSQRPLTAAAAGRGRGREAGGVSRVGGGRGEHQSSAMGLGVRAPSFSRKCSLTGDSADKAPVQAAAPVPGR